jgi:hypothetical protein
LPEQPPIEHHRAVDYRVLAHPLQSTGFTVTPSQDGRRIDVSGICPGCGGHTTMTWHYGTGNGYKGPVRRAGRTPPPAGARTVCCDCGHSHANRPEQVNFLGCGSYWPVELP